MLTIAFALCIAALAPQDPSADLVAAVQLTTPEARKRAVTDLLDAHRDKTAEQWLATIQQLPVPIAPLADVKTGRIERRTVELWTGKSGVLSTEIGFYLPSSYDGKQRLPVLLAAHGTGGSATWELQQWRSTAEALGMVVVASTEQKENDGYHFAEYERLTQLSLLHWAAIHLVIDLDRAFFAGTSRGGHLAWDVGTRFPDRWAGLVPIIGGPRFASPTQNNMRVLPNLIAIPIRDLQGSKDSPDLLWNLHLAFKRLAKLGAVDAKLIEFDDLSHGYRLDEIDWKQFYAKYRRAPFPTELRFACVKKSESRSFWLQILSFDRNVKEQFRVKVHAAEWKRLDRDGKRLLVVNAADKRTATVHGRFEGTGAERVLRLSSKGVRRVRLLLPKGFGDAGDKPRLTVKWNGRTRKVRLKSIPERLLLDWVERVDPGLAPVLTADLNR